LESKTLPIAAVINEQILCVHGGLCPELKTLQQLETCDKANNLSDTTGVLSGILWSDPHDESDDFLPSSRDELNTGTLFTWGPAVTQEFLTQNGLKMIVRAHDSSNYGFCGGGGAYVIWTSKSTKLSYKVVQFNTTSQQQERRKM